MKHLVAILAGLVALALVWVALAHDGQPVSLVGGRCNPTVMTWAGYVPVDVVAQQIVPLRPDDTLWMYLPVFQKFVGWQRGAPAQVNTLVAVPWLGVVDICVSGSATLYRPVVR